VKTQQARVERKRSKRNKRLSKKQNLNCRRLFPKVFFENDGASPAYYEAVQQATRLIIRNHLYLFEKSMSDIYRKAANSGFPYVLQSLTCCQGNHFYKNLQIAQIISALGELLNQRLQKSGLTGDFPVESFDVCPGRPCLNTILIRCRGMERAKLRGGTAYHSKWEPTVSVNGQEQKVAFCRHAIERICERAIVGWRSFGGWTDAFAYLFNCIYFEPYQTSEGEHGFVIYQQCRPGFLSHLYGSQVIGELDPQKKYYYRVGYCPVVCENGFAAAKTMLIPGMRGTPERSVLEEMASNKRDLNVLDDRIGKLTLTDLAKSLDFGLIRMFHNAIPQVVSFNHKVFRSQ